MTVHKQNQYAIYVKTNGPTSAMAPLGVSESAMADITLPGAGRNAFYVMDRFGRPILLDTGDTPPGGLPATTITVVQQDKIDFLQKQFRRHGKFPVQRRWMGGQGVSVDNPTQWVMLDHLGFCRVTQKTLAGAPNLPYGGEVMQSPANVEGEYAITLLKGQLSALNSGETENLNGIVGLAEPAELPGYPGPDRILYTFANAATTAKANVYVSTDGGSTWTVLGALPFANDEHIIAGAVRFINRTQFRVILLRGTADAGNPPEIAYFDVTLGGETATPTYTNVNIGSTSNEAGEALAWLEFDRLYVATAGDIRISTDQGASFGSAIYSGSTVINGFARSPFDKAVYAFGASNLLLREPHRVGTFATLVGPTGSDANTAMAIPNDGRLYLGNGAKIFRSFKPVPAQTSDWVELKDFGANKAVKALKCIGGEPARGGDPDLLYAVVDDTSGGQPSFWLTADGGVTWEQIPALTATGYNGAYFPVDDDNLVLIPGDAGAIHKYAPATA